ncbi:hypothetical protein [Streptomyces sp. NPDC102437]|uniref:hypothetical protein n=1 Tax=Streptomyces sp. NPDC102437 TaxID=3366175 RepID=UPI0038098E71
MQTCYVSGLTLRSRVRAGRGAEAYAARLRGGFRGRGPAPAAVRPRLGPKITFTARSDRATHGVRAPAAAFRPAVPPIG